MDSTYELAHEKDNRSSTLATQFSVVLLWPALLVAAPLAVHRFGWWTLAVSIPMGVYFVMWIGLLRHEVFHRNFSRLPSRKTFDFLSYLIFLDPRPYWLAHGPHHRYVHTTRDVILFCERYDDPKARKRAFVLEFILGNAAWEFATLKRFVRAGNVSRKDVLVALPKRLLVLVVTALLVTLIGTKSALAYFPFTTFAMAWASSLAARHVQWVEHLGVVAEGSMVERSMLTRNLTNETLFGWVFNTLTCQEAWNHTYHHVAPERPLSSIDKLDPETTHVVVDGRQYWKILTDHYRSL
ncbi:MAG TPA: fatty acid desaturase [Labilithrix sp.]|nr:fatty acid desaturase [Labilithrix sp.]